MQTMLPEEEKVVTGEAVDNTDYITAIKELKQNSVDRTKYDQVVAEKKALLDALVNGEEIEVPNKAKRSIDEIRRETFKENSGLSAIQYVTNVLELREALMSEGKPDPFLPTDRNYVPHEEDYAEAQKVADVFRECLDYADGDNQVFINELNRRMVDSKR